MQNARTPVQLRAIQRWLATARARSEPEWTDSNFGTLAFPDVFAAGARDRVGGMFLGHELATDWAGFAPGKDVKPCIVLAPGYLFGLNSEILFHKSARTG
jgi:hypothetical protein